MWTIGDKGEHLWLRWSICICPFILAATHFACPYDGAVWNLGAACHIDSPIDLWSRAMCIEDRPGGFRK